jgi:hypothetical protein
MKILKRSGSMAKKTTPKVAGRGTWSAKGLGEQEAGVAVPEAPQAKRGEVVERPGTRRAGQPAGPTHEQIALRAQEIWNRHGCPPGEDQDNWFEAEAELRREMGL